MNNRKGDAITAIPHLMYFRFIRIAIFELQFSSSHGRSAAYQQSGRQQHPKQQHIARCVTQQNIQCFAMCKVVRI